MTVSASLRQAVVAATPNQLTELAGELDQFGIVELAEEPGLSPAQDEALTVRATRSALAKLDVDASRLLN